MQEVPNNQLGANAKTDPPVMLYALPPKYRYGGKLKAWTSGWPQHSTICPVAPSSMVSSSQLCQGETTAQLWARSRGHMQKAEGRGAQPGSSSAVPADLILSRTCVCLGATTQTPSTPQPHARKPWTSRLRFMVETWIKVFKKHQTNDNTCEPQECCGGELAQALGDGDVAVGEGQPLEWWHP